MAKARTYAVAISTLVLLGTAPIARAEQASAQITVTSTESLAGRPMSDQDRWGPQPVHKSLQWDQKGRWGLKLDMNEPVGRDMQMRDVQAGAFYRVTPSLRVGGAVALADQPAQPDRTTLPNIQSPRVKLETTLKF